MTKPSFAQVALTRAALLGATALALATSPLLVREATAKVGVTSATEGNPLGKPPQEAERVLRIGIDVQANELITTNANDRAHLVFLDGSSLTVGPNAQITIDKFVFDPNTKTGELAISASKGVLRLVGGKISKNTPITITTPSSTIGIRGGISIHDVSQRRTDSMFVFGKDMVVTSGGQTQIATRQGSMISANLGGPLSAPMLVPAGTISGPLAQLEGRPNSSGNSSSGGGGGAGRNPDQSLRTSGFSAVNSNQAPRIIAPGVAANFGSAPGPRNRTPNETIVTVLSNTNNQQVQQHGTQAALQEIERQRSAAKAPPAPPLPPPPTTAPIISHPRFQTPGDATASDVSKINVMTGTARYNGIMIGTTGNGIGQVGSYSNVWNFGSRSGVATVEFGDARFQARTTSNGNSATFNTNGRVPSSNIPSRTLELNGSFLANRRGDHAAYQFGNFNINGPRYQIGGLFGAVRQ